MRRWGPTIRNHLSKLTDRSRAGWAAGSRRDRTKGSIPAVFLLLGCIAHETGCAGLAGIDLHGERDEATPEGGSVAPHGADEAPLVSTPGADCPSDVVTDTDPENCGACGHSCLGLACRDGRCEEDVVVSAATITDYATNGVDLFVIADGEARQCASAGPANQRCASIVSPRVVRERLRDSSPLEEMIGGAAPKLSPRALALRNDRIMIADDTYHAVLSCPTTTICDERTLGSVDARESYYGAAFGRPLATGPGGLIWTQGNALVQSPYPEDAIIGSASVVRTRSDDTEKTTRIMASKGVFWLSSSGLHHASAVGAAAERWSSTVASDFAVDGTDVYLATRTGVLSLDRAGAVETPRVQGDYERVAASGGRVYVTYAKGSRVSIAEVVSGKLRDLATVDGEVGSLSIVGDWLYYGVRTDRGSDVRRLPR